MRYAGMPFGMWVLFAGSFQKQLTAVRGYDADTARAITKKAKPQYRQIIRRLPEFEKVDRFKMNLVNCAMIGAFILSMPQRIVIVHRKSSAVIRRWLGTQKFSNTSVIDPQEFCTSCDGINVIMLSLGTLFVHEAVNSIFWV